MRIFVTGGTGYVGGHTVAELTRTGHDVRLLVRDPERIAKALAPHGVEAHDYAIGDVTDPASVEAGMKGCDAALHAASIYSLDVRAAKRLNDVNVEGTKTVLGVAEKLELDPVVYVSSFVAFFPPHGIVEPDSPVQDPPGPYYASKAKAERVARGFQERGVPVVCSYPSGAFGPLDPHFGESAQTVANILKRLVPVSPKGGLSIVDVRDVAKVQAAMFEPGRGARRYMLSGTNVSFSSLIDILQEVTGRRVPHVAAPAWALRPAVRMVAALQHVAPFRLPLSNEGFDTITWDPRGDDSRAVVELGFAPRPLRETLSDMVAWMYAAGKLSAKQAGRLARAEQP